MLISQARTEVSSGSANIAGNRDFKGLLCYVVGVEKHQVTVLVLAGVDLPTLSLEAFFSHSVVWRHQDIVSVAPGRVGTDHARAARPPGPAPHHHPQGYGPAGR